MGKREDGMFMWGATFAWSLEEEGGDVCIVDSMSVEFVNADATPTKPV